MKKIFLSIALILSYVSIQAQNPTSEGKGKITGIVIDAENNEPVPFATVALINPTTQKPVDGTVCDEKGKFSLTKISDGTYNLLVSFIGYKSFTKNNLVFADKANEFNLGKIMIEAESKVLNEINVEGKRELIEEKVDRTVYNAEQDATAKGGDAADVLRRVPLLSVDLDGNVSLRGNQNITVLINNKPSSILANSVADALRQIPAESIKSVEVITSPSARYDAEGSAGIINIITKKNTLRGLTLNINSSAGYRGSNLGLNGSLRTGKMGFSLGGWGRANYNQPGSFENIQETIGEDGNPSLTTQQANTRQRGIFGRYNLGWDYDIDKRNLLTASLQFGVRNQRSFQDNLLSQTFQDDFLIRSSLRNVDSEDFSNTVDFSLSYTHLFKKPQQELSILGLFSRNNRTNDFINNIMNEGDMSIDSRLKNINESFNQEKTFQIDYQSPVGKTQMIEFGAKTIIRFVSSDFSFFTAEGASDEFVLSEERSLSNVLNYDQYVNAAYFSYTLTTPKKFSLKVGSRYEYTTIDASFQDGTEVSIPDYGVLVPSINLSQRLKNGNTIKLAYNRRIQRPSIQFLNPNIQAANPLNITIGNPSLDPEFTNNFELSYSTSIKGATLSISSFARNTNNAIQRVVDVLGSDTIRTTFQNIGQENAYGVNLFMNVSIGKKFTLNGGTDIYYATLRNNVPDPLYNASNEGWVASYRMSAGYNFNKGWGVQFFGFYRARRVLLQGIQGNFGIYSMSLRKDFNNKRGSVGFGFDNFLGKGINVRNTLESPIINQTGNNFISNLGFRVNFNYTIGKMSFDSPSRRRRSINNDDLKEGGDNDGGGGEGQGGGGRGFQGGGRPSQQNGMPNQNQKGGKPSQQNKSTDQKPENIKPNKDSEKEKNKEKPKSEKSN